MVLVTRKVHFNAAHRLHNPNKSEQWNKDTFGPCNNSNWHGHNYVMEVSVAGEPDPETGYLIDLGTLKKIIEREIIDQVDHKNLNIDVPFLEGIIPSTENLVKVFFHRLKSSVEAVCANGGTLFSVRLYETERNFAEYRPSFAS